ncbi:MAG: cobalamin-binding protein [Spirochaetota bacterium]
MAGPERIVCLTEETTEWLYLLGEERRIVGVSAYTVRPPEAKIKPRVSAFLTGNIKKIKSLKPDLVIGFSDIQSELAAKLIKEGLNVLVTNQRSLAEIEATLLLLAGIVGKTIKGEALLKVWKRKISTIRRRNLGKRKVRVFFQEWDEPVISAIGWVSELIEICGGKNIFAGKSGAMAKDRIVTVADVLRARPEVIIGSWCGKPMNRQWLGAHLASTPALQSGQVYEIDSAEILQPGPALFIDGIDRVEQAISAARSQ